MTLSAYRTVHTWSLAGVPSRGPQGDVFVVLLLLAPFTEGLVWTVRHIECTGAASKELAEIEQKGREAATKELLVVLREIEQVIEGSLCGTAADGRRLTIRIIDNMHMDIAATDQNAIIFLRSIFGSEESTHQDDLRE